MEIGQAIRRARGRPGGKPRAMRDIHPPRGRRRCRGGRVVKALPHPPAVRPPDRNRGFPRLSDGPWLSEGAHGLRGPASPRHALRAESLGKPSPWVTVNAPWHEPSETGAGGGDGTLEYRLQGCLALVGLYLIAVWALGGFFPHSDLWPGITRRAARRRFWWWRQL